MSTLADARNNKDSARHILCFSGGKDSTALAIYMLEKYGDLPFEFVFTDTGVELPETYAYIRQFEEIFGVTVKRINALQMLGIEEKGERTPFDVLLNEYYGGFLPSQQARWCTRMLKIVPLEKYIGTDTAYSYIGIRADENREGYSTERAKPVVYSEKPNIVPVYPFKEDNIDLAEVKRILNDSGLGLPPYYEWRSRSGCYFCFYQQIGEWQGLRERHPELFEKAKAYEKTDGERQYTWVQGRSLVDIERIKDRYQVPSGEDLEGCAICHL